MGEHIMSKQAQKKKKPLVSRTFWFVFCLIMLLASLTLFVSQVLVYIRAKNDIRTVAAPEPAAVEMALPSASPAPTSIPSPSPTPIPSPSPSPEMNGIKTVLTATSTQEDLYIIVRNEEGYAIEREAFTFDVTFPNGETYTYDSDPDGGLYLVRLSAGEYTVRLREKEGYAVPEPITAEVKAPVAHVAIADIEDVAEITTEAAISDEVKTGSGSATPAEVIRTEQEVSESEQSAERIPVLDANGNPTYTYSFRVDENNYLYFRDSDEVSDVILVQEERGGETYGLRLVIPQPTTAPEEAADSEVPSEVVEGEENTEAPEEATAPFEAVSEPSPVLPYYETVVLIYRDNTVNETYAITAEPITQPAELSVGWQVIGGKTYYFDGSGEKLTGLKNVDGRLYFFDDNGVRASSLGVDVSSYNGSINWAAAKANGIDFAIVRIGGRGWTSGLMYDDSFALTYLRNAKNAGLKVGLYFYSTAIDTAEAVEEASLCISRLGGMPLDFPIYFDSEFSGEYPNGRADLLTTSQRTEIARAFCETISNSGYRAGVYASQNFYYSSIDYSSICHYSIWLANYTQNYRVPDFAWSYNIWQFTSSGKVNGFSGAADMNVIF